MLAVSSSNHRQRSGQNLADGHAIPGSGLLLTTWQTPTLGFWKQERMLRTGSIGGCLRSIVQRTRSGACSYWIGETALKPETHSNCWQVGNADAVHATAVGSFEKRKFHSTFELWLICCLSSV